MSSKKLINRAAIAILLAASLVFAPSCGYKLVQHGQVNQNVLAEIERKVAASRGLPFIRPVEIELITEKQAELIFEEDVNNEYPPEKIHALERAYEKIGLVDPGFDLKKLMVQFYSNNVAGFYDPKKKKLYLMKKIAGRHSVISFIAQRDMNVELTLAHELTHALEDQHFDLEAMDKANEGNDDAAIAFQALGEGSATITGILVVGYPKTNMSDVAEMIGAYRRMTQKVLRLTAGNAPLIFVDSLVFAYGDGAVFVAELYKASNGWDLVNRAYKNPPKSSESVLNPNNYVRQTDPPIEVSLPVAPGVFGDDFILLEQNTLGELGTTSLLRRYIDESAAAKAAHGWGGDRFAVVGTRDGKKTIWIWITEWDSDDEAAEFYSAYRSAIGRKYKGARPITSPAGAGECWENPGGELIWMNRSGGRVVVVEGADADSLRKSVGLTAPSVVAIKSRYAARPENAQTGETTGAN